MRSHVRFWPKADIYWPSQYAGLSRYDKLLIPGGDHEAARRRAIKPKARTAPSTTTNTGKDLFHLSRQRDGLRLIMETALDAVVIMKSDGIVADWNDRARACLDGRQTRRSGGIWPTSSSPSDTAKHTERDFDDTSKAAKEKSLAGESRYRA